MKIQSLNDLMIYLISDMTSAEKQQLSTLDKMVKKVANPELKKVLEQHLKETQEQINRLDQACKALNITPSREKCEVMEGLVQEAEELIQHTKDQDTLDAALIAAAQRVKHYEISSYGTIVTYAKMLDKIEVANLISQILSEEKKIDEKLSRLAESAINQQAES